MKSSNSKAGLRPVVFVLSGPSGAGKDSVLNHLKSHLPALEHIITATTRRCRPGEQDGMHYRFLPVADFHAMIDRHELLEYANVYGNWYGVPNNPLREALAAGKDTIIKVDVQGAMSIREVLPDSVLLFLMPPCREDLVTRLQRRNTEAEADLERRLQTAGEEMEKLPFFDYAIVNADGQIEKVVSEIVAIITAEKLRTASRHYEF